VPQLQQFSANSHTTTTFPRRLPLRHSERRSLNKPNLTAVGSRSRSHFTTDGQSVNMFWCRAPLWGPWPDFTFYFFLPENCFTETGLKFVVQSVSGQSWLITTHYYLIWDCWVPFLSPLTTRRDYSGSIPTRLHTGLTISICCPKSKLLYGWRCQYVLVSSTLVGLATRYYLMSQCCCLKFEALFLWGALSDERTDLQFAV
jgi:hypothetical protein